MAADYIVGRSNNCEQRVQRLALSELAQRRVEIMAAIYSVSPERVDVTISGRLGYNTWRVLRDARIAALEHQLPLHLDISACHGGDMGGLGALMIAQHQLGKISIDGCDEYFSTWFNSIGVCNRCHTRKSSCSACANDVAKGELVA
jgi:hypothetical protein